MPGKREDTPERRAFVQRVLRFVETHHTGRSYTEWAKRLGTDASFFTAIKKGAIPGGDMLMRMAKEFNVDGHWLLTGEGSPVPKSGGADRVFKAGGVEFATQAIEQLERMRAQWSGETNVAEPAARRAFEASLPEPVAKKRA